MSNKSPWCTGSRRLSDTSNQHFSVRAPRPLFLPGAGGVDVSVPQSFNPYVLPGAETNGLLPMIAAPILVRIDGGDPESSLSGGLDGLGRLRPLDRKKFALFHIPSAVYPAAAHLKVRQQVPTSAQLTEPSIAHIDHPFFQRFVPLSMPSFDMSLCEGEEPI